MIGYTSKAKVRRFATGLRTEKTLITKEFTARLESEIERVVSEAVGKITDQNKTIEAVGVQIPDKQATVQVVCNQRVRERATKLNPDVKVSKRFLTQINTYACTVIVASMERVEGAYLKFISIGAVAVDVVKRAPGQLDHPSEPVVTVTDETKHKFEAALPREHVAVAYDLHVQDAIIHVQRMLLFTAKTTKQVHIAVTSMVKRTFAALGVEGEITIVITEVTREKKKGPDGEE